MSYHPVKVGDAVRIFKVNKKGIQVNPSDKDIIATVTEVLLTCFKAGGITFKNNFAERNPKSYYARAAELIEVNQVESLKQSYQKARKDKSRKITLAARLAKTYWGSLSLETLEEINKIVERGV